MGPSNTQKINWEYKSLPQLGFIGRGKSKHRPRDDESLYGGNYPFIQTSDIKHANFYVNSYSQTYNETGLKQSKLWEKETLCMTIAANIAETALLSFPACFPDSVVGFIADPDKSNSKFIKYALDFAKKNFQKTSKGTAQDNLSLEKIETLKISVPDIETQTKISSILFNYDNLIEINEKRIKALEELAQLIYTEWFVKFKFPGHEKVKMVDSKTEYGMIPEGWKIVNLKSVADILFGFNFKSNLFNENNEGVKVVRIRDVLSGTTETYTPEIHDEKYLIEEADLLIGMDGIFHISMWFMDKCYLNQRVARIRSINLPSLFIFESIKKQLNFFQKTIVGATVGHLSNGNIRNFNIFVPDNDNLLQIFKKLTNSIINLKLKNQNLIKTRDLLIPQLVTGKRIV